MGWWLIDESGSIKDFEDGRECQNAIPEKDDSKSMYGGDVPADIMGKAVSEIVKEYEAAWKREPSFLELISCLKFVTAPMGLFKEGDSNGKEENS